MTHLLLVVLVELGCADVGFGVVGAASFGDVVDAVSMELVMSDAVLLLGYL